MVRQPVPWSTRIDQAATLLGAKPEAVEAILLDRLKLNTSMDLDSDDFEFEAFYKAFDKVAMADLKKAFAVLHTTE